MYKLFTYVMLGVLFAAPSYALEATAPLTSVDGTISDSRVYRCTGANDDENINNLIATGNIRLTLIKGTADHCGIGTGGIELLSNTELVCDGAYLHAEDNVDYTQGVIKLKNSWTDPPTFTRNVGVSNCDVDMNLKYGVGINLFSYFTVGGVASGTNWLTRSSNLSLKDSKIYNTPVNYFVNKSSTGVALGCSDSRAYIITALTVAGEAHPAETSSCAFVKNVEVEFNGVCSNNATGGSAQVCNNANPCQVSNAICNDFSQNLTYGIKTYSSGELRPGIFSDTLRVVARSGTSRSNANNTYGGYCVTGSNTSGIPNGLCANDNECSSSTCKTLFGITYSPIRVVDSTVLRATREAINLRSASNGYTLASGNVITGSCGNDSTRCSVADKKGSGANNFYGIKLSQFGVGEANTYKADTNVWWVNNTTEGTSDFHRHGHHVIFSGGKSWANNSYSFQNGTKGGSYYGYHANVYGQTISGATGKLPSVRKAPAANQAIGDFPDNWNVWAGTPETPFSGQYTEVINSVFMGGVNGIGGSQVNVRVTGTQIKFHRGIGIALGTGWHAVGNVINWQGEGGKTCLSGPRAGYGCNGNGACMVGADTGSLCYNLQKPTEPLREQANVVLGQFNSESANGTSPTGHSILNSNSFHSYSTQRRMFGQVINASRGLNCKRGTCSGGSDDGDICDKSSECSGNNAAGTAAQCVFTTCSHSPPVCREVFIDIPNGAANTSGVCDSGPNEGLVCRLANASTDCPGDTWDNANARSTCPGSVLMTDSPTTENCIASGGDYSAGVGGYCNMCTAQRATSNLTITGNMFYEVGNLSSTDAPINFAASSVPPASKNLVIGNNWFTPASSEASIKFPATISYGTVGATSTPFVAKDVVIGSNTYNGKESLANWKPMFGYALDRETELYGDGSDGALTLDATTGAECAAYATVATGTSSSPLKSCTPEDANAVLALENVCSCVLRENSFQGMDKTTWQGLIFPTELADGVSAKYNLTSFTLAVFHRLSLKRSTERKELSAPSGKFIGGNMWFKVLGDVLINGSLDGSEAGGYGGVGAISATTAINGLDGCSTALAKGGKGGNSTSTSGSATAMGGTGTFAGTPTNTSTVCKNTGGTLNKFCLVDYVVNPSFETSFAGAGGQKNGGATGGSGCQSLVPTSQSPVVWYGAASGGGGYADGSNNVGYCDTTCRGGSGGAGLIMQVKGDFAVTGFGKILLYGGAGAKCSGGGGGGSFYLGLRGKYTAPNGEPGNALNGQINLSGGDGGPAPNVLATCLGGKGGTGAFIKVHYNY